MVRSEKEMVTIVGGIGSVLRAIRIFVVTGDRIIGINSIILYKNSKNLHPFNEWDELTVGLKTIVYI